MWDKIVNPVTGRKVNINGIIGRKILNNYILTGGGKTAYMGYGRFQPPHKSHGELVDLIIEKSEIEHADAFLFTSQKDNDLRDPKKARSYIGSRSENAKKKKIENPIQIEDKLEILYKLHGHKNITIVDVINEQIKDPFRAVTWLKNKGYTKIIFFAGSDRFHSYQTAFRRDDFDMVEIRELLRPVDSISGTEVREIAIDTIFDFISRFDEINRLANDISADEIHQLDNIIKLYSKIKGKDKCYKNLYKIFKLLNNSKDETCKENIDIIRHIVDLVQKGSKIPKKP